jgi:hypothetical protein
VTKAKSTIVSSKTVRLAFTDGTLDPATVTANGKPVSTASLFGANGDGKVRGRLHTAFGKAYESAFPGTVWQEHVSDEATVEVPRVNAKGRALKPASLPISEARRLAGDAAGKRGILSAAALEAAGKALMAG